MLEDMEKTISMAELTRNADRIVRDIERGGVVYRIKRPGRRTMLLMDKQHYENQLWWSEFVARHPNWKEEMDEARRDLVAGRLIPLDVFLKERGLDGPVHTPKRRRAVRRASRDRRKKSR